MAMMSDKIQIVCRGCEATLAMPGTPEQVANRKIRCPKCQTKFIARPEMIRVVNSAVVSESTKSAAPAPAKRKPARPAEEIFDDDDPFDDVDIIEEDDELPETPPTRSSRSKRSSKRDEEELDELPTPTKKKKKKSKSKPAPERSFGTAVLLWTVGGILGGFLGGGLWWVIAYSTGWNVWYLSVLTGTAVGIGVRLGAAQYEGWMPATTAVVLTLFAVFLSKLTLNYTVFYDEMPGMNVLDGARVAAMSQEELVAEYAHEVVAPEYRKQGKPVDHPQIEDEDYEDYSAKGMYHPDLWAEAETRWKAMPEPEQAAFKQNLADRDMGIDRKSLIHHVAEHEIKPEFERANKPVMLTEAELDAVEWESEFKPEVVQEAEKRFETKTPEERALLVASIRGEHEVATKAAAGVMIAFVLLYTCLSFLWPGNLICLVLACISAYQIGNYDGVTT